MDERIARALLAALGERLGDRVVLWRGPDVDGADIDLLVLDGAEDALAAVLLEAGLRRDPSSGGSVWRGTVPGAPEADVTAARTWPGYYPRLDGLLRRASRPEGLPLVASEEDRLAIFAAEAVGGAELDRVARRARVLLARPGVAERMEALGREAGMRPLVELVADPDRLQAAGRRGRLSYTRAVVLAARSVCARRALSARLRARGRAAREGLAPRRRPRDRLIVAISGMDGAGKSTAARTAVAAVEAAGIPAQVSWVRFVDTNTEALERIAAPVKRVLRGQPRVASELAAGGAAAEAAGAQGATGRGSLVAWVWVLVVAAVNARDYRRAAVALAPGHALICDRWAVDALVDLEVRYGRHRAAAWLIRRVVPTPDLAMLLSIDPATAAARKPDDQARRVLEEMAPLYAARARAEGLAIVDAGAPAEHVQAAVRALVSEAVDALTASPTRHRILRRT